MLDGSLIQHLLALQPRLIFVKSGVVRHHLKKKRVAAIGSLSTFRMTGPDGNPGEASAPAPAKYKGAGVAVIGAGVAGCVAASSIAERGIPVRLFEMGRGPGGRLSTRRELTEDGELIMFDHGAQYMTVNYPSVQKLMDKWKAAGLVEIWDAKFGSYNFVEKRFSEETFDDGKLKYVGVPGMNSMCKTMSVAKGVRAQYNTMVVSLMWKAEGLWNLTSQNGEDLGVYGAVVVTDKALALDRFEAQTGLPPPLSSAGVPDMYRTMSRVRSVPCFTVMVAFPHPLTSVTYDRFTIEGSDLLAGAVRVSSKPGRKVIPNSEYWVLHSSVEFAKKIVNRDGLSKPSRASLESVAQTLLRQFQEIVPEATNPIHLRAHRWGSSFPIDAVAPDQKCLMDSSRKIVACGDFCVSPRIDGAILSGLAAADSIHQMLTTSDSNL